MRRPASCPQSSSAVLCCFWIVVHHHHSLQLHISKSGLWPLPNFQSLNSSQGFLSAVCSCMCLASTPYGYLGACLLCQQDTDPQDAPSLGISMYSGRKSPGPREDHRLYHSFSSSSASCTYLNSCDQLVQLLETASCGCRVPTSFPFFM